ncbi:hypothetical protein PR003_g14422 [Phytophthora rubi]|uniref:Aminotransferase class I/classII large domain-containing protein n=1 Tax=Phytophthora rubi TaxID=129364 RepID=A0A6A4F308_9STRA|nr:hypothetical protein PR003_g14422 [Phytophthora rubi]
MNKKLSAASLPGPTTADTPQSVSNLVVAPVLCFFTGAHDGRRNIIVDRLRDELAEIKAAGKYKRERVIMFPQGAEISVGGDAVLNFCANNYLALDTIVYPSCFGANAGLFEVMLSKDDSTLTDELNHASIIDGIRLCKAVRHCFEHMTYLEQKLKDTQYCRTRLIATDGVFTMDGDVAPLQEIVAGDMAPLQEIVAGVAGRTVCVARMAAGAPQHRYVSFIEVCHLFLNEAIVLGPGLAITCKFLAKKSPSAQPGGLLWQIQLGMIHDKMSRMDAERVERLIRGDDLVQRYGTFEVDHHKHRVDSQLDHDVDADEHRRFVHVRIAGGLSRVRVDGDVSHERQHGTPLHDAEAAVQ